MAETIGLVASVLQVAGAGLKLSQTLYQYADSVNSADRRIKDIAKEVQLTSLIVDELGILFKQDMTSSLLSRNALKTADETVRECSTVFLELDTTITKHKKSTLERLKYPFREPKIELLRSHIDKLKSTLQLLMQVLTHAHQIASNKRDREAEIAQREEIKILLQQKKQSTQTYKECLRKYSTSENSTLLDEDLGNEESMGEGEGEGKLVAASISSTITAETLDTCVTHIHGLLENIEDLQRILSNRKREDDHADCHQSLVSSYFKARSHLDSVLLGNPGQAEVQLVADNPSKTHQGKGPMVRRGRAGYVRRSDFDESCYHERDGYENNRRGTPPFSSPGSRRRTSLAPLEVVRSEQQISDRSDQYEKNIISSKPDSEFRSRDGYNSLSSSIWITTTPTSEKALDDTTGKTSAKELKAKKAQKADEHLGAAERAVEELKKHPDNSDKAEDHGINEIGIEGSGYSHLAFTTPLQNEFPNPSQYAFDLSQADSFDSYQPIWLPAIDPRRNSASERETEEAKEADERLRAAESAAERVAEELEKERAQRCDQQAEDLFASLKKNTQFGPKADVESDNGPSAATRSKDNIPISPTIPARQRKKAISRSKRSSDMLSNVQCSQSAPPSLPPPWNSSMVEPEVLQVPESQPSTSNEGNSEVDELLREWTTLPV